VCLPPSDLEDNNLVETSEYRVHDEVLSSLSMVSYAPEFPETAEEYRMPQAPEFPEALADNSILSLCTPVSRKNTAIEVRFRFLSHLDPIPLINLVRELNCRAPLC